MKIAVLADIHGNLPALEVVVEDLLAWRPDQVIVNGDVVNRGPCSQAVMTLISRALPTAQCLKGNHEEFVLSTIENVPLADHTDYELRQMAHWTAERLDSSAIEQIRGWDNGLDLRQPDGGSIHITHASRRGSRDGIFAQLDDAEIEERIAPQPDLFITAHTHKSGLRQCGATLIVNPGSVGTPLEGDHRATYGRLEWRSGDWHCDFRRLDYDRDRLLRDIEQSGFIEGCGPTARLVQLEFLHARSHVGPWMRQYHARIEAQEIGVAEAVEHYLAAMK